MYIQQAHICTHTHVHAIIHTNANGLEKKRPLTIATKTASSSLYEHTPRTCKRTNTLTCTHTETRTCTHTHKHVNAHIRIDTYGLEKKRPLTITATGSSAASSSHPRTCKRTNTLTRTNAHIRTDLRLGEKETLDHHSHRLKRSQQLAVCGGTHQSRIASNALIGHNGC